MSAQVDYDRRSGEDRIVRHCAVVALGVLAGIAAVGCSDSSDGSELGDNERAVQSAAYGSDWPLTVSGGVLRCEEPSLVTFTTDNGTTYAVNGSARGFSEDRGWVDDISPIWRDDPAFSGLKISIGPLIDDGLALCEGQ
jgi:Protein of unknown function (DUF2511)